MYLACCTAVAMLHCCRHRADGAQTKSEGRGSESGAGPPRTGCPRPGCAAAGARTLRDSLRQLCSLRRA
eukprot:3463292-Rhodomonas_salina.3